MIKRLSVPLHCRQSLSIIADFLCSRHKSRTVGKSASGRRMHCVHHGNAPRARQLKIKYMSLETKNIKCRIKLSDNFAPVVSHLLEVKIKEKMQTKQQKRNINLRHTFTDDIRHSSRIGTCCNILFNAGNICLCI